MAASRRKQLHELAQTAALILSEVEDPDEAAVLLEQFNEWVQDELWMRRRRGRADALLASLTGLVTREGWLAL